MFRLSDSTEGVVGPIRALAPPTRPVQPHTAPNCPGVKALYFHTSSAFYTTSLSFPLRLYIPLYRTQWRVVGFSLSRFCVLSKPSLQVHAPLRRICVCLCSCVDCLWEPEWGIMGTVTLLFQCWSSDTPSSGPVGRQCCWYAMGAKASFLIGCSGNESSV